MNVDGCAIRNPNLSTTEGIIRIWQGVLIEFFCKNLGVGSNNRAEAIAAWKGIKRIKELNMNFVILQGDSKLIIDYLNGNVGCPWFLLLIL